MTVAAIVAGVLVVASAVLLGPGRRGREDESAAPPGESGPFITRATTHPGEVLDGGEFLKLPPGERTFTRIYDRVTGEPKYIFRADAWNPVSDAEFHVTRPEVQVHTPEGQVTFLQADEGQIVLAQSGRRSAEPKRGWLRGNVRVSLDRTTKKWRSEHPDAADMQQHPDQVIRIFLDEVSFDLDRARVEAEGPIRVQSVEADIDGTGLTIAYNQVDNRIDLLTIRQGRKMALRRGGGMVDFGMPGTGGESTARRTRRRSAPAAKPEEDELRPAIARARAMEPASVEETAAGAARVIRAESAEGDGGAALAEPVAAPRFVTTTGPAATPGTDDLSQSTAAMSAEARQALAHASTRPASTQPETLELAARRARGRIDTYSAVFTGNVVVEQRQGTRRPGRLVCDSLEIIFDFGRRQRQTGVLRNEGGATSRPARETAPGPSPTAEPGDDTQLVLTWNGPLEMRPLAIPEREKSGARFDCIATGRPLRVDDGRGEAVCRQLVYRNERKQVWLSGSDEEPVQLVTHGEELRGEESPAVVVNGRLRGREVFFDRSRGLARIDGPGEMLRSGGAPRGRGTGPTFNSVDAGAIQWTRGVELELRQIGEKRTDPNTGAEKTSFRDFISRAWFHGQVRVERGDELIAGEDVAATFGPPTRVGASNGPLMHLDAQGKVRLERRPDVIRAQTLQVDFALTPDGRDSYPRRAHAEGARPRDAGSAADISRPVGCRPGGWSPRRRWTPRRAVSRGRNWASTSYMRAARCTYSTRGRTSELTRSSSTPCCGTGDRSTMRRSWGWRASGSPRWTTATIAWSAIASSRTWCARRWTCPGRAGPTSRPIATSAAASWRSRRRPRCAGCGRRSADRRTPRCSTGRFRPIRRRTRCGATGFRSCWGSCRGGRARRLDRVAPW
ncbi:MAG: hypothetical protein U1A27_08945 [Phycisphaerae bacterium]